MPYKPLVTVAIAYIAGTLLYLLPGVILPIVSLLLLCAVWFLSHDWKHLILHCIVIAAASGTAALHTKHNVFPPGWEVMEESDQTLVLEGFVSTDTDCVPLKKGGRLFGSFAVRMESLTGEDGSILKSDRKIDVLWYGRAWDNVPGYGETWRLSGRLVRRGGPCFISDSRGSELITAANRRGVAWSCFSARRKAAEYLVKGINQESPVRGVLLAMLLGYRSQLGRECKDAFIGTGTLHIFAISGLHVGILVTLIMWCLKWLKVSRIYWGLYMAPMLIFYAFITGARASAVRACIMAIIYCLAPLLGRKPDALCAMALSAIIILVWAPTQVLDTGFIYSFTVVACLVILYPIFNRWLQMLEPQDPFETKEDGMHPGVLKSFRNWLLSSSALSCAAWFASAPLTAYFFGRFTPVALLANIVVIPVAYLVVLTGSVGMLVGLFIGLPAILFGWINLGLVTALLWFVSGVASVPYSTIEIGSCPLWCVLLWYAVLGCFAVFVRTRRMLEQGPKPLS